MKRGNSVVVLLDDEGGFRLKWKIQALRAGWKTKLITVKKSDDMFNYYTDENKNNIECLFLDYNLIGETVNGVDVGYKINKELGNGVHIYVISTSDGTLEYGGNNPKLKGLTELDAAKQSGFYGWVNKGQDGVQERLKIVRERVNNNIRDFKYIG